MPVSWKLDADNLGVFIISGKLTSNDLGLAQNQAETVIHKLGEIRFLIILDNFAGWEKGENWDDFSFGERNDPFIKKIAIVGDRKWEDLVYAFTLRGLRPFPIEYFNEGDISTAQQWLLAE